jgi:hypothetical protein
LASAAAWREEGLGLPEFPAALRGGMGLCCVDGAITMVGSAGLATAGGAGSGVACACT